MTTDSLNKETTFRVGIERLEAAFRHDKLSKGSIDIYYDNLKHITNKRFLAAVDKIIKTENFFPSIATLISATREKTTPDWL